MKENIAIVQEDNKYFLIKEKASKVSIADIMMMLKKFEKKESIDFQKTLRFASSKFTGKIDISKDSELQLNQNELKNDKFTIEISENKMEATIDVTGKNIKSDKILESLNDLKISFGINFDLIEEIEKGKKKNGIIAKGILPVDGKDGYIEMLIEKPSKKPILSEDGRVNFYELDMIKNVKKGEIIAVRHVPSKGRDGINIFSKKIAAKPGKFAKFNLGKGIKIVENKAIAEFDGCAIWNNDIPNIEEILLIKGDVDASTGNIETSSHVHIKGWVRSGFKVKAEKNIQIDGGIENAVVESENGSVVVKLGITGGDKCVIQAKKEIRSKFINNANITSDDSIIINEYIMNSTIRSKKNVILNGKKGELINVDIEAKGGIMVNYIKSMKKSNHINIYGIDRNSVLHELKNTETEIKEIEVRMRELSVKIKSMSKKPELKFALIQLIEEYQHIKENHEIHVDKVKSLKSLLSNIKGDGMLKVFKNKTYTKVKIKDRIVNLEPSNKGIEVYYDPDKKDIIKND